MRNRTLIVLGLALSAALAGALVAAPAKSKSKDKEPAKLGVCGDLGTRPVFPLDNPWNQDISKSPVDPASDTLVASIGADTTLHPDFGKSYGIAYVVVPGDQPRVPVSFTYAGESDPGPYPVPPDAPIEGGPDSKGDRHILLVDRDHWILYELYKCFTPDGGKSWKAGAGAIFDLSSNKLRPAGWTSADAAGLAILPGLERADEVLGSHEVTHAVRFTCRHSRRAYVPPATHQAATTKDPNAPPMGMRVRLKAGFDTRAFPASAQVILEGLKKYGMILADNGSDWYITGTLDPRWNDQELNTLKKVKGRDFEVVKMEGIVGK